jgi:hypothetical protein
MSWYSGVVRPTLDSAPRPLERAQVVWRYALDLVDDAPSDGHVVVALDLLRTAHHDVATLAHARVLGMTRVRAHPDDVAAAAAVARLNRAIVFLGVRPTSNDIAIATLQ